jgi:retron-type reverse transcriptase
VLQKIIDIAVHPIVESQADTLSFGFRPNRPAIHAASLLVKLLQMRGVNNSNVGLPKKVSKDTYDKFHGKKTKIPTTLKEISGSSSRRLAYNYNY